MYNIKAIVFFFYNVIMVQVGCSQSTSQDERLSFVYSNYQTVEILESQKDTSIAFINLILAHDYERSQELLPELFNIDVAPGIISMMGKRPFLGGVGDYIDEFSTSSYDLLNLAVFLRVKYNARLELYDKIIRGSLRLDPNNLSALYLLAKLRYENGMENDAYYLISKLRVLDSSNTEIKRIYETLNRTLNDSEEVFPTFEEFVRYDVTYYEQD